MRQKIEETLALWREAERQLDSIREGEGDSSAAVAREREVIRLRARFQNLTATYMMGLMEGLSETETLGADLRPSMSTVSGDRMQAMSAEVWGSSMALGRQSVKQ